MEKIKTTEIVIAIIIIILLVILGLSFFSKPGTPAKNSAPAIKASDVSDIQSALDQSSASLDEASKVNTSGI